MAAMVCEPARPSPTAAPMAPPPSARPPPTSAPAVRIAVSVELDIGVSLCWSVFFGRRHADVHDREQREDQCLDRADEEGVERLPHEAPEPGGDRAHDGVAHDDRDHDDHERAGEQVPEESERERDRLGDLLDDVDRRHERQRLREVPEVASEPSGPERQVLAEQEHGHGHRRRQVDVRRRRREQLLARPDLQGGRDELEPVAHEDEEEQHEAEGDPTLPLWAHDRAGELAHLVDHGLERELELAGRPGRRLRGHPQPEAAHDGGGHERRDDHRRVEGEPEQVERRLVADRDLTPGVLHGAPSWATSARATLETKASWNSTRPTTTPMPSGATTRTSPIATTVSTARRSAERDPIIRRSERREASGSTSARETWRSIERTLRNPRPTPRAMPRAPSGESKKSATAVPT